MLAEYYFFIYSKNFFSYSDFLSEIRGGKEYEGKKTCLHIYFPNLYTPIFLRNLNRGLLTIQKNFPHTLFFQFLIYEKRNKNEYNFNLI